MSRIRTIKPEFWKNEGLSALPEATVLLAAALLNASDDDGYFNANPALLKAECFPLREPSVSIRESLTHLSNVGYLRLGQSADGKHYGHIINFKVHQRVNRPTPSSIKRLEIVWEASLRPQSSLSDASSPERKGKEEEGKDTSADADPNDDERSSQSKIIYPQEFEEFWSAYPTDKIMSKKLAFTRWQTLSDADQASAVAAVPDFRAYCSANPTYRPVHAERFLSQRRFDGFAAVEKAAQLVNPSWNGSQPKLEARIGADSFGAYFADSILEVGPPARILFPAGAPARRERAERKFGDNLREVFGDDVVIDMVAP